MKTPVIILLLSLSAYSQMLVSGQVTTLDGNGVSKVRLTATTDCGQSQAITNGFGYYLISVRSDCGNMWLTVADVKHDFQYMPNAWIWFYENPAPIILTHNDFVICDGHGICDQKGSVKQFHK